MQLQKEVKREKGSKISIQVTVPKESVGSAHETVINDFENNTKIPGFRKGKVPRSIILSRFADSIKNETISSVLSDSLSQILKETEYRLISEPSITKMGDLVPDESFSFTAECDIMPEVKLGEYKGISSMRYIYDVKDSTVKKEIERLREQFANLVAVDKKAAVGDYVVMDYVEEGSEQEPGDGKEDETVFLDKEDDPLTRQLVGLGSGETRDVELEHEYEEEGETKTKKVAVHVKVKEVKKKELPELNDDFAKDISDVETLAELKKAIKEDLKEQAAENSDKRTKDELMRKVIEGTTYDIPETLINHEINRILNEVAYSYRIDLKELSKDEQKYKEYRENLRPRALESIKYELALAEIGKDEKISVSDEEVDDEIRGFAERQKKNFDELKKRMTENDSFENSRYRLRLTKTLNFLRDNAKLDEEKHLKYGEQEENA